MFLRYLKFSPGFFSHVGKLLDKKVEIHFNIYDLIDWEKYNYNTYILANISRSEVNQTAKVGPLKGCFFETYTQQVLEKLLPDLFLKTQNWAYPLSSSLKYYTVCFYRMPRSRLLKYIEFKVLTRCFNLAWVLFKKTKRGLKLVYLPQILHSLWGKIFNLPIHTACLSLFAEILDNICTLLNCF